MSQRSPNSTDVHIGKRIRMLRLTRNLSQTDLAKRLGITFQQIQKYEKGTNRIGASRLQHIARVLSVPVSFFFEDAPGAPVDQSAGMAEPKSTHYVVDFLSSAEGLQLNKAFIRIKEPKLRRRIIDLVRALAGEEEVVA